METGLLGFAESNQRAGFRLHRFEVYTWGIFHKRVWSLPPSGDNALLVGDSGSGKSTLMDAITTLLVPAQRIAYNKAAGADARERSLRSYLLGTTRRASHESTRCTRAGVGRRSAESVDRQGGQEQQGGRVRPVGAVAA